VVARPKLYVQLFPSHVVRRRRGSRGVAGQVRDRDGLEIQEFAKFHLCRPSCSCAEPDSPASAVEHILESNMANTDQMAAVRMLETTNWSFITLATLQWTITAGAGDQVEWNVHVRRHA
jgi:hypothetical protein